MPHARELHGTSNITSTPPSLYHSHLTWEARVVSRGCCVITGAVFYDYRVSTYLFGTRLKTYLACEIVLADRNCDLLRI